MMKKCRPISKLACFPILLLFLALPAFGLNEALAAPFPDQATSAEDTGYFTNLTGFPVVDVTSGRIAWGDYDNDADPDLLVMGSTSDPSNYVSKVYRNDNGSFTDINAPLIGAREGAASWGDYDDDGDLDILLTGNAPFIPDLAVAKVYRNDSGSFTDINAALTPILNGDGAWGDYDNDGDLDILVCGDERIAGRVTRIYRNDNGSFVDINAPLVGVTYGSVNWGDYDNDGDLDILLNGYTGSVGVTKVYRNDGGVFADINADLLDADGGDSHWSDHDSDGDLDITVTGYDGSAFITKLYRNDNSGAFADSGVSLLGFAIPASAWADFDNDGRLDFAVGGYDYSGLGFNFVFYRNLGNGNFVPLVHLSSIKPQSVAWADYDTDGDLDIAILGNSDTGAVDTRLYCNNIPLSPRLISPGNNSTQLVIRPLFDWTNFAGATSYTLQISTNQNFTSLVLNMNVSASAYTPMSDLPKGTTLFWRVRANRANGPSAWSRIRHFDTPNPPSVPTLLTPAQDATVANSQPTLDWSDSSPGVDHYEVQISTSAAFATVLGRGQGGRAATSQYTPEVALTPDIYYWRARTVNTAGQFSNWSVTRSFRVP